MCTCTTKMICLGPLIIFWLQVQFDLLTHSLFHQTISILRIVLKFHIINHLIFFHLSGRQMIEHTKRLVEERFTIVGGYQYNAEVGYYLATKGICNLWTGSVMTGSTLVVLVIVQVLEIIMGDLILTKISTVKLDIIFLYLNLGCIWRYRFSYDTVWCTKYRRGHDAREGSLRLY